MAINHYKPLALVVQVRSLNDAFWESIAAFNDSVVAHEYAVTCAKRGLWKYRVIRVRVDGREANPKRFKPTVYDMFLRAGL